ncbi:glycosyltransferase family 39 protein [Pseudanabaena minima]|uniref:glycosyltransferase family 39 protein n=1 Tax=Pseudanabaena minima TaxID=890415 RepID=UPI003DA80117
MLNFQIRSVNKISQGLRFLFILILVAGIFLRFNGLDKRIYWLDEVATSFRIAGFTTAEVAQQLYDSKVVDVNDLQKFQKPSLERNWSDTINSLVVDDAQHPPLYFVMVRFWAELVGSSPAMIRILSVLISLLIFPCIYWLCIELFNSPLLGWIAITLTSFSLLHLTYAQEAREYSLWIVTILCSSAAFLRAIRLKTKTSFAIYAISIIVGLYTFPITGIVLLGHGIYLAVIEKFRLTKILIYFLISAFAAILSYIPWIWIILTNTSRVKSTTSWMFVDRPIQDLVYIWLVNITHVFVHYSRVRIVFLIIFLASLYFMYSKVSKRIWLFVLTSTLPTLIIFTIADLVSKSSFSFIPRYLWPFLLGTQVALTCVIGYMIASESNKNWLRNTGIVILIITLIIGFTGSTAKLVQDSKDDQLSLVADIINKSESPLLINFISNKENISVADVGDIFSLSYLLQNKAKLFLFKQPNNPKIPNQFKDIFVFYHIHGFDKTNDKGPDLSEIINQGYQVQPVVLKEGDKTIIWKLKPT